MAAKGKSATVFFCQSCGYESTKWMGQCPGCKEWNTFAEERVVTGTSAKGGSKSGAPGRMRSDAKPSALSEISLDEHRRITTGIGELDRVLGGGIVPGSLVLVGGDPGIGKSTLLLQMCRNLADGGSADRVGAATAAADAVSGETASVADTAHEAPAAGHAGKVLYVSGEESLAQIKMRAMRIGDFSENLLLYCETDLAVIEETIRRIKPQVVIIDSIQTMYSEEVSSAPGSVSQVREATGVFLQLAKGLGISVFLVGHVTKEGTVAGPRVLEHMVDTVLYFEGERHASYRILRGVKNRFGSTNEIGVFEMRREGLAQVTNPSEYMLNGKPEGASGSVVACSLEGTRPLLIEVQALVCHSNFGIPRRQANGTDFNRVNLLMAVLEKRVGLQMSDCDAYVNLAGGMRITEPAMDLGIVMAVASSFKNRPIQEKTVVFGEVGLSGEIRAVSMAAQRAAEAAKLGFTTCILPQTNADSLKGVDVKGMKIIGVSTVADAIGMI